MDPVQNLIINNNQPANVAPGKDSVTVPVTVNANLAPGTYSIVFRGQAQIPFHKDPKQKQRPNTPVVLPSSALTLTVLPKALANVSLQPQGVTVKVGKQAELTVRVNRLFEYDGEFRLEVVVPPAVKGVTVEPAVIPAGKNEAKVVVKAAADAAPGNRANLVVRAVALFNGKVPTKHEVKFNVNVVK
jgi:hypothetical protein